MLIYERAIRIHYVETARRIGEIRKGAIIPELVAQDVDDIYPMMEDWLKENGVAREDVRVRTAFAPFKARAQVEIPRKWLTWGHAVMR